MLMSFQRGNGFTNPDPLQENIAERLSKCEEPSGHSLGAFGSPGPRWGMILAAVSFWVTFELKDHRQQRAANIIKATVTGNNFKIPKWVISTRYPYKN